MTLFTFPELNTGVISIESRMDEAVVVERKNRFLADISLEGRIFPCHIHDPGRLRELIFPGSRVLIRKTAGQKTDLSVTAVILDNGEKVLLDTRFHNSIGKAFIRNPIGSEKKYLDSRFDFQIPGGYVEIKGCSMQVGQYVVFPDAPTERGAKHLRELTHAKETGMDAGVVFLVLRRGAKYFYPNLATDVKFSEEFFRALDAGVEMIFPKFTLINTNIVYCGNAELSDHTPEFF